ncbi:hypothetical protein AAEU31_20195 [Pseudoalteromonas sp. SSMSWG5]|uniref:hypothetical protein n=1 Tax=Pseudoalteromonas sp. SSMSWG5 TaxID=3139396 RepID=UPI003BA88B3B
MFTNRKTLLAMSVASVFALSGCSSDDDKNEVVPDPIDPPTEVVVPPEAPAELGLVINTSVIDSATTDVVDATVTFLENGVVSSNIVDVNGEALTTTTTEDGSIAFSVKEGATLEEVTVNVTATGYVGKTFAVSLVAEEGETSIDQVLALTSKTAAGIADKVVEATVEAGGTTSAPIEAATEEGASSASATVPAGVILLDENEEPVSGEITLNVTGADATSSAAQSIVPANINDADAETTVKAVGVANVIMTNSDGKKIKKFSNPITVSMAIPADTMINGEAIQTGDMLGLKSHNEDTGLWQSETNMVTVGALNATSGTYTGSFQTSHLTFFASTVDVDVCTSGISVAVSGDDVPAKGLTISLDSSDATYTSTLKSSSSNNVVVSPGKSKKEGISSTATAFVTVTDNNGQVWYESDDEVDVCGEVPVQLSNPVTYTSEAFTVTAVCSNDASQTIDMSNALVRYSLANKKKVVASGSEGTFELAGLVQDSTYNVFINARIPLSTGGATATTTITADGTDESIELSAVCETVTGS